MAASPRQQATGDGGRGFFASLRMTGSEPVAAVGAASGRQPEATGNRGRGRGFFASLRMTGSEPVAAVGAASGRQPEAAGNRGRGTRILRFARNDRIGTGCRRRGGQWPTRRSPLQRGKSILRDSEEFRDQGETPQGGGIGRPLTPSAFQHDQRRIQWTFF